MLAGVESNVGQNEANPRYVDDCNLAILLRWESTAPADVDAKARDIFRKLAAANEQLPTDRSGIVHIGFEAVEDDAVERARYEKILTSTARFDPAASRWSTSTANTSCPRVLPIWRGPSMRRHSGAAFVRSVSPRSGRCSLSSRRQPRVALADLRHAQFG